MTEPRKRAPNARLLLLALNNKPTVSPIPIPKKVQTPLYPFLKYTHVHWPQWKLSNWNLSSFKLTKLTRGPHMCMCVLETFFSCFPNRHVLFSSLFYSLLFSFSSQLTSFFLNRKSRHSTFHSTFYCGFYKKKLFLLLNSRPNFSWQSFLGHPYYLWITTFPKHHPFVIVPKILLAQNSILQIIPPRSSPFSDSGTKLLGIHTRWTLCKFSFSCFRCQVVR